ncbi:MAG: YhcG family protein [Deltaproteobacteria bacterium]|nr:YhcG family protein [Deltaproteobacteria bacterium]
MAAGRLDRAMPKKTRLVVGVGDPVAVPGYEAVIADVARHLESARRAAARSVNAVMTSTSRDKAAMLRKGGLRRPEDAVTPEEEIKDPFVLEFLSLKDEYSESDLEAALIVRLESFLLELGGLSNKILAMEYRTALPAERVLADELTRTRRLLEARRATGAGAEGDAERACVPMTVRRGMTTGRKKQS